MLADVVVTVLYKIPVTTFVPYELRNPFVVFKITSLLVPDNPKPFSMGGFCEAVLNTKFEKVAILLFIQTKMIFQF
jgi:hypothetical protein